MNSLIELYDNSLIYYPNIFFPILFLLIILGTVLLVRLIIFLDKESGRIAGAIKISLSRKKIKKRERIKIPTSRLTMHIFYLVKFARNFIVIINNISKYCKLQTEKIIMKIRKEVLID